MGPAPVVEGVSTDAGCGSVEFAPRLPRLDVDFSRILLVDMGRSLAVRSVVFIAVPLPVPRKEVTNGMMLACAGGAELFEVRPVVAEEGAAVRIVLPRIIEDVCKIMA